MFDFRNSETLAQAKLAGRRPKWGFQILIFLAVMLVVTLVQGILTAIVITVWQITSATAAEQLLAGQTPVWMTVFSLFATALETGAAILYCKCIEKRSMRSMGCKKRGWLAEYAVGFGLGAAAICAAAGIAAACGAMSFQFAGTLLPVFFILFLAGYLVQGMAEEFLLRGYFLVSLSNRVSLAAAVGISSVVFAALHLANDGITVLAVINLTLFGIFAAVYMLRWDSIWGICAFHSAWNFFQGNILGVQVSGGEMGASLFAATAKDSELINGGAFGLEGGLAVTAVLVLAIALTLFLPGKKAEEERV